MKYKLTPYHIKYYANELVKISPSDSIDKFTRVLSDAQVDLNPHQINAALFAFKSPLSKGAILADEVGLGKTIEAGIILSQKWAEGKRKILIICPSSLRKQWSEELSDKFYLKSKIIDGLSFNKLKELGYVNPFDKRSIVICSYHFAKNKEEYIKLISWDLAILDEAHKLRGVFRNSNKIASSIKNSLIDSPKLLLTATPLQNSLLELYGLTSYIDDYVFGDLKSYKNQFVKISEEDTPNFEDLKERLQPICMRTLRKDVLEYIKYTNRIPIAQEYIPTDDEIKLYDKISDYLQKPVLFALPSSQRHLVSLILRRLLASSTFAIAGTLDGLINKLNRVLETGTLKEASDYIKSNFSDIDELSEELDETNITVTPLSEFDKNEIKKEINELKDCFNLAKSIKINAKGEVLLTAIENGFSKLDEIGASKKALIFTEFRRTQTYIESLLANSKYKDQIVLFNGTNNDEKSNQIYANWLEKHKNTDKITGIVSADKRIAIIDYFKNNASIMIATEAAAEGINLQFCSLVVNYDLPWNPQRIEQRIGRCHRYGQNYDVVVINFLNTNNDADKRVYELLDKKFKLFSGVFGASDEVLGILESGLDFEKRIIKIYQECRTAEEIKNSFDKLQLDLEKQITISMNDAKKKLLENFDEEVHEKLKISLNESKEYLNKFDKYLWNITKYELNDFATFDDENNMFVLNNFPFGNKNIKLGKYKSGKQVTDAHVYRFGCELAQNIIKKSLINETPPVKINFNYSLNPTKINYIDKLKESKQPTCGEIALWKISLSSFEKEEYIIFTGITDSGKLLSKNQCEKIFDLQGDIVEREVKLKFKLALEDELNLKKQELIDVLSTKNTCFFDDEIQKLEKWGDDKKNTLKKELKDLEDRIKNLKKDSYILTNLSEKIERQKEIIKLDHRRDDAWKEYENKKKEIDKQIDQLIKNVQSKMNQKIEITKIFEIQWEII